MLAELTRVDSVLPLATSLAAVVAARGLLAGRRRTALNEALHELRRPLHALVLSASSPDATAAGGGDLPRQAALALQRLDREINGGPEVAIHAEVSIASQLEDALVRWRLRAELGGASLFLDLPDGDPIASVDRAAFGQALDNLIINAIEHGGPLVVVGAAVKSGTLRVTVADSGRPAATSSRRRGPMQVLAALSGRGRHGHGLRVVRRVAAAHRGEFRLRRLGIGVEAMLELPLPGAHGVG